MRLDTYKNQTSLVISKNELKTKFNEIKRIVNKNVKNPNFVLVVTCDLENKKDDVPYSYQPDEINKLLDINNKFEQHGYFNRILFSEGVNLMASNISNHKINCWALPIVLEVNKKIDRIVQKIKDLNLTPYETVLYIHRLASKIEYSCKAKANTMGRESEATLLGLSDEYKHLCCVGYSSFVKAIIDKLNSPNLSANVNQFQVFQTTKKTEDTSFIVAHATNTIYINDPHYGIKGFYFEDATPTTAGSLTDFSACLVPIPDMQHFKGRVYRQLHFNSAIENIHAQINIDGKFFYNVKGSPDIIRNKIIKFYYESLPFQDAKTHKFTKDLKYSCYPINSFEDAYTCLLSKLGEKDISQAVAKAMDYTVLKAGKYFDKDAENCFAKEFYESYQYLIADKNKDI